MEESAIAIIMNLFCLEFVWPILLIEFRTVFLNIEKHGSVFSKIVCYYNIKIKECQHTHSFSLSHGNEPFSVSQYQFVYTFSTTLIASVKILAYPIVFLPRTTVLYIFCHFSKKTPLPRVRTFTFSAAAKTITPNTCACRKIFVKTGMKTLY